IPHGLAGAFGPRIEKLLARLPYLGTRPAKPTYQHDMDSGHVLQPGKPVLKAEGLYKSFGGLQATDNVSFELYQNEILAIIGPNGAGKTTVFNQMSGFLAPDKGTVSLVDRDGNWTHCKSPDEFAHKGMGRTFQTAKPFTGLTV